VGSAVARGAAGAWNLVREPAQALRHLERALALALADPSIPADERATVARNIEEAKARLADGPDAELARGREAASKAGGHVEALAHFEEAVRLRPDFVEAWVEIAAIHKWKGNFRDAYAALDRAVAGLDAARAKPDDPRRERLSRLRALYERAQREADARERDGK
jgi:tetratricopeptide (TPR) repeat protein